MSFCKYLKEIKAKCDSCYEDKIGACHISLGSQEYYNGFALSDIIMIIRHNSQLSVETDIEIKYKTDYPYGRLAGKGPEFSSEYSQKEAKLRDYLESKLPPGVTLLRTHQHYQPDVRDPSIVAMHIHAHKSVEDLDEAAFITQKLVEVIKPREIERVIEKV